MSMHHLFFERKFILGSLYEYFLNRWAFICFYENGEWGRSSEIRGQRAPAKEAAYEKGSSFGVMGPNLGDLSRMSCDLDPLSCWRW